MRLKIRTEPVGRIPRPLALLDAIRRAGSGSDPALESAYVASTRDTLEQFESTGHQAERELTLTADPRAS